MATNANISFSLKPRAGSWNPYIIEGFLLREEAKGS
jgi:hypothetical protein